MVSLGRGGTAPCKSGSLLYMYKYVVYCCLIYHVHVYAHVQHYHKHECFISVKLCSVVSSSCMLTVH